MYPCQGRRSDGNQRCSRWGGDANHHVDHAVIARCDLPLPSLVPAIGAAYLLRLLEIRLRAVFDGTTFGNCFARPGPLRLTTRWSPSDSPVGGYSAVEARMLAIKQSRTWTLLIVHLRCVLTAQRGFVR